MLITTCTHCRARFRVTPQQLNLRQGQVRCGRCDAVFNGFQALERVPDDDTGGRLLAAEEARRPSREAAAASDSIPRFDAEATMPDLESVVGQPGSAHASEDVGATAPPPRETRMREPPAGPQLTLREPPRRRPSRAWSLGVAMLVMVLAAELAFIYRGPVAQRYPPLRPALEAACAKLGCSVPYAREDGMLKLEESEMLEVPGKPGEIALSARMRNLASVAQEYPHLELTLTDNTAQAAARRVLRPTDYLGRPVTMAEVIAPGVEIILHLRIETPNLKATGYELLLFYP